ncbi:hypothetical protein B0H10DRAFT_2019132 [Mycena sp. CBHHK59/15]|nr:hypothetical protein B0H10DRAFT_2019132 [Mycena sp. CBHHK59/15]
MLPLDAYIYVLGQLTAHRTNSDVSVLVNFSQASTFLREAALVPSLWEPHYRARYLHSEQNHESISKLTFSGNWRLMYIERRKKDKLALRLLDEIVSDRALRYQHAGLLVSMSFDVWDALEIETLQPVPPIFGGCPEVAVAPHALTRRFWAESVLGTISRRFAIIQWGCLVNRDTENSLSFVDAFSSLSCFFGKAPQEMASHLAILGNACHEYLIKEQCLLDPDVANYDLQEVCSKICRFMHEQGFGAVEPTRFYDISNHFPHVYLTTNKRTIPISLVHVFVSLARHQGIIASPVEFPARVLVHVSSPPGADDFFVDVYGAETKAIISVRTDIPMMLMRLGIPPDSLTQYISPCGAGPMLLRAARNILSSFRNDATRSTAQSAIYAALVSHMLSHVDLHPLYCATFLSDLQPLLRPGCRRLLEQSCKNTLEVEAQSIIVRSRSTEKVDMAYFVGMVFEHRLYRYIGCIIGWEPTCMATEEWKTNMNVRNLPRGVNQPFYHVLSIDGSRRYVAEDNIGPVVMTDDLALQFFKEIPVLPMYFSDVQIDEQSGPSQAYPDDDAVGRIFIGTFTLGNK